MLVRIGTFRSPQFRRFHPFNGRDPGYNFSLAWLELHNGLFSHFLTSVSSNRRSCSLSRGTRLCYRHLTKQMGVSEFWCCLGGPVKQAGPRRENGSFSGREDKSPWKEFATEEDGWYPGRKRRFSFLVSPAKRRYISRSLVVRTGTNRTTYRWPVLILVSTNLSYYL
jgi:hypothetical protein